MDKIKVKGNSSINGELRVSGAKNSILPILFASTMADSTSYISNIPHLKDVTTCLEIIGQFGCDIALNDSFEVEINPSTIHCLDAPEDLVSTMRASILALGPLLAKFGRARIASPGGCAIGDRKMEIHLEGFKQMGAKIEFSDEYITATCPKLQGAVIDMPKVTVTGTENLLMAAVLAEGTTVLKNCAYEPEVTDLLDYLVAMGAEVSGRGTRVLEIQGVPSLKGVKYRVIPDRIEAGTFLVAAAVAGGAIKLKNVRAEHLTCVLDKLRETGCSIDVTDETIYLDATQCTLKAVSVETEPYPGFPTDMQAQWMVLNSVAEGDSVIQENIFENRFMHASELNKMDASITIDGNDAYVKGSRKFKAAQVEATDLRASASLILAGLVAEGDTIIDKVFHVDRGYELIEEKFHLLGASIMRLID